MKTLRELYIETGAITPSAAIQHIARPVLKMDRSGHEAAARHIAAERDAVLMGTLCDIPLDQVPDFVLEAWERRERRHVAA